VIHKTTIEEDAAIGHGVWLSRKGNIIMGAKTLGKGSIVHHNVTIGYGFGSGRKMQRPQIGNNVWIGPGTVIYGNIRIGDGAVIAANSVVNRHVPPRCVIGGNPPRLICKSHDTKPLMEATSVTPECHFSVMEHVCSKN
jgi:serine O-acetyltransferase